MRRIAALALVLLTVSPAAAGPREELLRVAPSDAAIVVVLQNAREHYHKLSQSPFVEWLPSTGLGKRLIGTELKQLRESGAMIFRELGTNPASIIDDIAGDAVAFAFSPAPPGRPADERAIILVRPRKREALQNLVAKLNELQTKSGELKNVVRKEHAGIEYTERLKSEGASEYYCFRGDLFAFSSSENDVKGFIDRDRTAALPAAKEPELVSRLKRLGVADAAALVLINPRPLDAEIDAHAAAARPAEKRFLQKFNEVWHALDSAALYLSIDSAVELGVSFRFQPGKLPANLKKWLTGTGPFGAVAALVPPDALFGAAGRFRATELLELIGSLAPVEEGKPDFKQWIDQTFGPILGRTSLPLVLDCLGPEFAFWAEPPQTGSFLPTFAAAVQLSGDGVDRTKGEKALVQALTFGLQSVRVAYNAKHDDQVEFREETDEKTGIVIRSLVNEKGFPPGFRPSFALVKGHLVLATSPEAVRRFEPRPMKSPGGSGYTTVAALSGTHTREYLLTHGPKLVKFLANVGAIASEEQTRDTLETVASVLELFESLEVVARSDNDGMQLALRLKPVKPLKK